MPLKLYADECVDARIVRGVQRRGVDVVSAADCGLLGASDELHIEKSRDLGRAVITADHDFLVLARELIDTEASFPGLIFILPDTPLGAAANDIALLSAVLEPEEMTNHIEWV